MARLDPPGSPPLVTGGADESARSAAVYRAVIDQVGLAIVLTDFESHPLFFNNAFRTLFGYSDEEWRTRTLLGCTHPDDLATSDERLATVREQRAESYRLRKRYVRRDGSFFWAQLHVTRLEASASNPACIAATIRDVSDLVAAEEEAARQSQLLGRMAALAPAAMFVLDVDTLEPVYLNERGRLEFKELELSTEAPGDVAIRETVHPDDVERALAETRALVTLTDDEVREGEVRLSDGKGGWRTVMRRVALLDRHPDGRPWHAVGTLIDLTEVRAQAEQVRLLSRVTTQAPFSIVITNPAGDIVYVNPSFETTTGYTAAEVLGRNPRLFASGETPLATYQDMWATILGGGTWRGELKNRRKDGTPYWEQATISGVVDEQGVMSHYVGIKEDVTQRRALSAMLADRAQQLEAMQELARVGAWRMSLPDQRVWRDDSVYRTLHVTPDTMPGTLEGFTARVRAEDRAGYREALAESLAQRRPLDHTMRLIGDDGVERTVRVRGRATYNAAGAVDGVVGAIQDVTELDTALRALGALNTELEQRVEQRTIELEASRQQLAAQAEELSMLNAELGRAARAKDEFLAGMSHELRTPLTSVLNLSEAMQEGAFGDISQEQGDVLQTVQDAGRHLLNLINDILDLSKIEAGQLTLDITECLAQDIARASAELTKGMLAKKHQRFTLTLPDGPVTVDGDPRRLKQILVNLLSNASKFTPNDGHISLELSTDLDRDEVLFRVTDDGIGIAAEDFGKLFRPFTQLDSKLSRHHAGTGLGLALVSRMAEMHGGGVRLESTAGTGSSFTLVLPWRRRATPIEAPAAVDDAAVRQPIDALILLADDNEMNLIAMGHYLRTRGFRVVQARNGVEAVTMAETHRPDLILMDIQMPDVDGLEATRHLRAHADARLAATPVIALTALVMPGDREACLAAGADDYVAKPSPLHHLIATIDRLLTNR